MSKTVPKGLPLEGLTEVEVLAEIDRTRKALDEIDATNNAELGQEYVAAHKSWREAEEALTYIDRFAPQGVGEDQGKRVSVEPSGSVELSEDDKGPRPTNPSLEVPMTKEDYKEAIRLGAPPDAPFSLSQAYKDEALAELGIERPEQWDAPEAEE